MKPTRTPKLQPLRVQLGSGTINSIELTMRVALKVVVGEAYEVSTRNRPACAP